MTVRKFLPGTVVADPTLGPREIRVIASTASVDRQGDILEPGGCDMSAYRANPVVLASHDPGSPVGTASPAIANGRIEAKITFAPAGISQAADTWCGLTKAGVVNGVSVGFAPVESEPLRSGGGMRFIKWELLEISLVAIPANAEALVMARDYRGKTAAHDEVDHLQAIADGVAKLKKLHARAQASHATTREHLERSRGLLAEFNDHAQALADANRQPAEEDDPNDDDSNEELATRIARRKARLAGLDRDPAGAAAATPPRELGGAFLTAQVREDELKRLSAFWNVHK